MMMPGGRGLDFEFLDTKRLLSTHASRLAPFVNEHSSMGSKYFVSGKSRPRRQKNIVFVMMLKSDVIVILFT